MESLACDFETAYLHHSRSIRYLAWCEADGDRDLREDLEQEGVIALWRAWLLDPAPRATAWVRKVVWSRMRDFLRREIWSGGMVGRTSDAGGRPCN